jgi:ketosteroid isomerase-like protein
MDDKTVRASLQRHWEASDASDFEAEHEIYREDAVLDYPQSGERIRGRRNIQQSRTVQPNGVPSYTVSIMEFRDGQVAHETQYFADRFEPAPSRAHLAERA